MGDSSIKNVVILVNTVQTKLDWHITITGPNTKDHLTGTLTPGPIPQDHLPQDPCPGTMYLGPFTPGPIPHSSGTHTQGQITI